MNGRLHAYCIDARAAAALPDYFFACLPDAERRRIGQLERPQDRLNRKVGYAALHWLACRHRGLEPSHIQIARDPDGKPLLRLPSGVPPLHVSLAHSGHFALLALASCPVGVDIEQIRPIDARLLKRDYFPRDALAADAPEAVFFAWWTLKEAALKAVGKGLGIDPSLIVAKPPERRFLALDDWPAGHGLETLRVASLAAPAGYAAAIAAAHPHPRVKVLQLVTDALLRVTKC